MKKQTLIVGFSLSLLVIGGGLIAPLGYVIAKGETEEQFLRTYTNDKLAYNSSSLGVFQTYDSLNRGESRSKIGVERIGGKTRFNTNQFLRLANYDSVGGVKTSTASLVYAANNEKFDGPTTNLPVSNKIFYSFNYRFFEGDNVFKDTDVVLEIKTRRESKTITYKELETSKLRSNTWHTLSGSIDIHNTYTSNRFDIAFTTPSDAKSNPNCYCDIDNVKVSTKEDMSFNYLAPGNFEAKKLEDSEITLLKSISLTNDEREAKKGDLLSGEDVAKYDENSILGKELILGGANNNNSTAKMLLRAGGEDTKVYRGLTSVGRNESDIFFIKEEDNTFLRYANYNSDSADCTRATMYYYDNTTDKPRNMKKTPRIYAKFSYRFYASDDDMMKFGKDSYVFQVSSRLANYHPSSMVKASDLIINEPGDMTWHTYSFTVNCSRTHTTPYAFIHFYHNNIAPSYNPTFYMDLDNMDLRPDYDSPNLMYHNGTFDGFINDNDDTVKENDSMPSLFTKAHYGNAPKFVKQDQGYAIKFNRGESISYRVSPLYPQTNLRLAFDITKTNGDPDLDIYLNGKNGTKINVKYGQDVVDPKDFYTIKWTDVNANTKHAVLYIAYYNDPVNTVDFISNSDLMLDNASLKEVERVNRVAGDRQALTQMIRVYEAEVPELETTSTKSSLAYFKFMLNKAKSLSKYASQERIEEMINLLAASRDQIQLLSVVGELYDTITKVVELLNNSEITEENKATYILLSRLVQQASMSDNSTTQEVVDDYIARLNALMEELKSYEN